MFNATAFAVGELLYPGTQAGLTLGFLGLTPIGVAVAQTLNPPKPPLATAPAAVAPATPVEPAAPAQPATPALGGADEAIVASAELRVERLYRALEAAAASVRAAADARDAAAADVADAKASAEIKGLEGRTATDVFARVVTGFEKVRIQYDYMDELARIITGRPVGLARRVRPVAGPPAFPAATADTEPVTYVRAALGASFARSLALDAALGQAVPERSRDIVEVLGDLTLAAVQIPLEEPNETARAEIDDLWLTVRLLVEKVRVLGRLLVLDEAPEEPAEPASPVS